MIEHYGLYFSQISNKLKREIDRRTLEFNVTSIQGKVIGYLYRESQNKDVYQRDVENYFQVRGSSISSIIHNLESLGYIIRESVQGDQRLKKLVLTEKALLVQEKIMLVIEDVENSFFSSLSISEKQELKKILDKISKTTEKY